MLDSGTDRVNYGDLLTAPAGFHLDFALGTTYSLDLDALTSACLSLGLSTSPDSAMADNPMALFAALSEMRGRLVVFCEKGKVRFSGAYKQLYSQIEDSIIEVDLRGRSGQDYPSFHPKLWILRFLSDEGPEKAMYRVCVLSRNLTFDASWDVAGMLHTDAKPLEDIVSGNRASGGPSLQGTLETLASYASSGRGSSSIQQNIERIAHELPYMHLKTEDRAWSLKHPLLFSGQWANNDNLFSKQLNALLGKSRRAIIVSPFLSDDPTHTNPLSSIYRALQEGLDKEGAYLVTRRSALLGQSSNLPLLSEIPIYTVRNDLVDDNNESFLQDALIDEATSEQNDDAPSLWPAEPRDIHAKIFVFEEVDATGKPSTHLFYGSANATRKGIGTNDVCDSDNANRSNTTTNNEAMAHLVSEKIGAFDKILQDLGLDEESQQRGSLFERLSLESIENIVDQEPPKDSEIERAFAHFLRRVEIDMTITESTQEYDVTLKISDTDAPALSGGTIRYSLITQTAEKCLQANSNELVFHHVPIEHLTEFARITFAPASAEEGSVSSIGIVKCSLSGTSQQILEKRRSALFKKVCAKDENALLEYLNFRLSDNPELYASVISRARQGGSTHGLSLKLEGLYENLIEAFRTDVKNASALIKDCLSMLEEDSSDLGDLRAMLEAFSTVKEG